MQKPNKPTFSLALPGGIGLGKAAGGGANSGRNLPALDFSKLKHVREGDWYAQCQKLEKDVIAGLRDKLNTMESDQEKMLEERQVQAELIDNLSRQVENFKKHGQKKTQGNDDDMQRENDELEGQ